MENTSLYDVCYRGDLDALGTLLKDPHFNIENLNRIDLESGFTPLMVAVYNGHYDIVKRLLYGAADLSNPRKEIQLYLMTPSGATVFDLVADKFGELFKLLTGELARRNRLETGERKNGFHETSQESFEWIVADYKKGMFPMVGGNGGYFGGGVYFAVNQEESSRKALSHGHGFECFLKMGNIYYIDNLDGLQEFRRVFCDGDSYKTPVDIMQSRLLEKGYDSVWGHHGDDIAETQRILKTGDEYVVYSADQIAIREFFAVVKKCQFVEDFAMNSISWISYSIHKPIQRVLPWRSAKYTWVRQIQADASQCMEIESLKGWPGIAGSAGAHGRIMSGDIFDFRHVADTVPLLRCAVYLDYNAYDVLAPLVDYYPLLHPLHPLSFNKKRNLRRFGKIPPLFLTEMLMEDLGLPNLQAFYLHYRDLLHLQRPKVYLQLYQHEMIKVGMKDEDILRWDDKIFPDFAGKRLFETVREHFEDKVCIYAYREGIVFIHYDPEFYISKFVPVMDLDGILSTQLSIFNINRFLELQLSVAVQKEVLMEFWEVLGHGTYVDSA
jgi:hypothetical protein